MSTSDEKTLKKSKYSWQPYKNKNLPQLLPFPKDLKYLTTCNSTNVEETKPLFISTNDLANMKFYLKKFRYEGYPRIIIKNDLLIKRGRYICMIKWVQAAYELHRQSQIHSCCSQITYPSGPAYYRKMGLWYKNSKYATFTECQNYESFERRNSKKLLKLRSIVLAYNKRRAICWKYLFRTIFRTKEINWQSISKMRLREEKIKKLTKKNCQEELYLRSNAFSTENDITNNENSGTDNENSVTDNENSVTDNENDVTDNENENNNEQQSECTKISEKKSTSTQIGCSNNTRKNDNENNENKKNDHDNHHDDDRIDENNNDDDSSQDNDDTIDAVMKKLSKRRNNTDIQLLSESLLNALLDLLKTVKKEKCHKEYMNKEEDDDIIVLEEKIVKPSPLYELLDVTPKSNVNSLSSSPTDVLATQKKDTSTSATDIPSTTKNIKKEVQDEMCSDELPEIIFIKCVSSKNTQSTQITNIEVPPSSMNMANDEQQAIKNNDRLETSINWCSPTSKDIHTSVLSTDVTPSYTEPAKKRQCQTPILDQPLTKRTYKSITNSDSTFTPSWVDLVLESDTKENITDNEIEQKTQSEEQRCQKQDKIRQKKIQISDINTSCESFYSSLKKTRSLSRCKLPETKRSTRQNKKIN